MLASVYLMKNMANGYYKIGSSRQPAVRERTLQSQEPDIRLLGSVEADISFERALHRRYAIQRVRGEWFDLDYGDLVDLKRHFSIDMKTIDPPVEVIDSDWWHAAVHRYSPSHHHTWVTRENGDFLFEVPFAMSRGEVQDQAIAESSSSPLSSELLELLTISLRNYIRDIYEIDGMSVELREICCLATGDSRGFIVTETTYSHHRYFPWIDPANRYFDRMRKYLDGYAQLASKRQ